MHPAWYRDAENDPLYCSRFLCYSRFRPVNYNRENAIPEECTLPLPTVHSLCFYLLLRTRFPCPTNWANRFCSFSCLSDSAESLHLLNCLLLKQYKHIQIIDSVYGYTQKYFRMLNPSSFPHSWSRIPKFCL